MALIDVVKFDGLRSRDWLVYKFPSEELVLGTQLIVQEGQAAIFVIGGEINRTFYPGTYTLNTDNLPILKDIVKSFFGGKTPFSAEVYFVNTAVKLDVNWGTVDPIQLIDPKYFVKLRIRAFGTLGLKVANPENLFRGLIGAMQKYEIVKFDKVREFYRGLLVIKAKSIIADAIINNKISALEISTKLESLSDSVKEKITGSFVEYGMTVNNFYIQSINFPDEDFEKINKILEDKAAFELMGDGRYATKRSFDVYEGAANNQNGVSGAFVSSGVGLGVALNAGKKIADDLDINDKKSYVKCYKCGSNVPNTSKFCPECGTNLESRICECGNKLLPDAKFCPECGKKVEQ